MSGTNRFDYLSPSPEPIVRGLEAFEEIYALEQMDTYVPLRTLPAEDGNSTIFRLHLTKEQRDMVHDGADVLVEVLHFGGPLAPTRMMLIDQPSSLSLKEDRDFARWFSVQTKGPYRTKL